MFFKEIFKDTTFLKIKNNGGTKNFQQLTILFCSLFHFIQCTSTFDSHDLVDLDRTNETKIKQEKTMFQNFEKLKEKNENFIDSLSKMITSYTLTINKLLKFNGNIGNIQDKELSVKDLKIATKTTVKALDEAIQKTKKVKDLIKNKENFTKKVDIEGVENQIVFVDGKESERCITNLEEMRNQITIAINNFKIFYDDSNLDVTPEYSDSVYISLVDLIINIFNMQVKIFNELQTIIIKYKNAVKDLKMMLKKNYEKNKENIEFSLDLVHKKLCFAEMIMRIDEIRIQIDEIQNTLDEIGEKKPKAENNIEKIIFVMYLTLAKLLLDNFSNAKLQEDKKDEFIDIKFKKIIEIAAAQILENSTEEIISQETCNEVEKHLEEMFRLIMDIPSASGFVNDMIHLMNFILKIDQFSARFHETQRIEDLNHELKETNSQLKSLLLEHISYLETLNKENWQAGQNKIGQINIYLNNVRILFKKSSDFFNKFYEKETYEEKKDTTSGHNTENQKNICMPNLIFLLGILLACGYYFFSV